MTDERRDPAVSVVIPTYMREGVLCDTLRDLLDQERGAAEILVIDQTPQHTPETDAFLSSNADRFRHIRVPIPSLPNARNVGVWNARGDVVVFVDDDVRIPRGFVSAHAARYHDPTIGGVAGRITGSSPVDAVLTTPEVGTVTCTGEIIRNYAREAARLVDVAPGGNMSFRRAILTEVGGFDPAYGGTANYEEADLCLRVRLRGHRIAFEPAADLVHLAHPSGGCGNRTPSFRQSFSLCHNSFLFALRYMPKACWPIVLQWRARSMLFQARRQRELAPLVAFAGAVPAALRTYLGAPRGQGRLSRGKAGLLHVSGAESGRDSDSA